MKTAHNASAEKTNPLWHARWLAVEISRRE